MIVLFIASALAQAAPATAEVEADCGGNTQQMVACANESYLEAERVMNAALAEALAQSAERDRQQNDHLSPTWVEIEQNVQTTWAAYRDAICIAEANEDARGGTLYPLTYIGCRTRMTEERTEQLRPKPGE